MAVRVAIVGLTSCFGCQVQLTNIEEHLVPLLDQIELEYWQLTMSAEMPEDFDVVVIEGAVTTRESLELVQLLRRRAKTVIALGACATTTGIPGLATPGFEARKGEVYGEFSADPDEFAVSREAGFREGCGDSADPWETGFCADCNDPATSREAGFHAGMIEPQSVPETIEVDHVVSGCPVDPREFLKLLFAVLYGSNRYDSTQTLCGECKQSENECFFEQGKLCLGLVTKAGCEARCVGLGRPCLGCRGLSPDANLDSARDVVRKYGFSGEQFEGALTLFNQRNPVLRKTDGEALSETPGEALREKGRGRMQTDAKAAGR